jgi:hypothetical protein
MAQGEEVNEVGESREQWGEWGLKLASVAEGSCCCWGAKKALLQGRRTAWIGRRGRQACRTTEGSDEPFAPRLKKGAGPGAWSDWCRPCAGSSSILARGCPVRGRGGPVGASKTDSFEAALRQGRDGTGTQAAFCTAGHSLFFRGCC